ncbi:hypothetical protein SCHPADRAFT_935653 [Schizopora paradoxa]|uniref:Uncharacterized protein n=1 Tax=Schizopora paradoxa TaxID=27342 RepID=A0A0H2SBG8_9AGAM|nr:hypothetical protein SCHPADRAFT_935653 [Schizopora paradoxa]
MAGKPTCIDVNPSVVDKSKVWEIKMDTLIVVLPWYRCHYKEADGSNCTTPLKHRITVKPGNSSDSEEEIAFCDYHFRRKGCFDSILSFICTKLHSEGQNQCFLKANLTLSPEQHTHHPAPAAPAHFPVAAPNFMPMTAYSQLPSTAPNLRTYVTAGPSYESVHRPSQPSMMPMQNVMPQPSLFPGYNLGSAPAAFPSLPIAAPQSSPFQNSLGASGLPQIPLMAPSAAQSQSMPFQTSSLGAAGLPQIPLMAPQAPAQPSGMPLLPMSAPMQNELPGGLSGGLPGQPLNFGGQSAPPAGMDPFGGSAVPPGPISGIPEPMPGAVMLDCL